MTRMLCKKGVKEPVAVWLVYKDYDVTLCSPIVIILHDTKYGYAVIYLWAPH